MPQPPPHDDRVRSALLEAFYGWGATQPVAVKGVAVGPVHDSDRRGEVVDDAAPVELPRHIRREPFRVLHPGVQVVGVDQPVRFL